MAQMLPAGLRGFEAGRQAVARDSAQEFQNFGQAIGMQGQLMQVQDMARKRQEEDQLKELFRSTGGDLTKMRDSAFGAGMYRQGLELDKSLREQKKADLDATEKLGKIDKLTRDKITAQNDLVGGAYEHVFSIHNTLTKDGRIPKEIALGESQRAWQAARTALLQNPMLEGVNIPEQFDPDQAGIVLNQTKRMKGILDAAHQAATFEETKRANQAREQAKVVDQGIARGNLSVSQGNLGIQQQRLGLERERFARDNDPVFVQRQEQAKVQGRQFGEAQAQAQIALPQATATAERSIRLVDELLKHPGFSTTVGATLLPGARFVPGTDAADFQARMDELKGGAFLQAFESLKGGGAITQVEGEKATQAITRMSLAQSEKEFKTAAGELQAIARKGLQNAQAKAGKPAAAGASGVWNATSAPAAPQNGDFSSLWK